MGHCCIISQKDVVFGLCGLFLISIMLFEMIDCLLVGDKCSSMILKLVVLSFSGGN